MRTAGEDHCAHFPIPVPDRESLRARAKIDRKAIRMLALFFGVPTVLFIGLKLVTMPFADAKRVFGGLEQAAGSKPGAPGTRPAIVIGTTWVNLDPAYRAYKVTIGDDSSLKLDDRPARLYGLDVIPRSKTCTYANGERWACGQRAYIALIDTMGSTTVDCRETNTGAPINADAPQSFICRLGTDLAELMLRQGWGTMQTGVIEKNYAAAAATARARQAGMWRPLPSSP